MGLVKRKVQAEVLPEPRSQHELLELLHAEDARTRLSAARELGGRPEAVAELVARFAVETDHAVRDAIGTAVVSSGSREVAHLLSPHLGSDDAFLRNGARELLSLAEGADLVARELLDAEDADVRMFALEILVGRLRSAAADLICELIDVETDVNVCAFAVEHLGEIGDLQHVTRLDALAERMAGDEFLEFSVSFSRKRILARICDVDGSN